MIHAGNPNIQILIDKRAVMLADATAAFDSNPMKWGNCVYLKKATFQFHILTRSLLCRMTTDMTQGLVGDSVCPEVR